MKYAKKSPEELQTLRRSLVDRLTESSPDIPQAARWIRESLGLNQEDFAKRVGLSRPQVARIERGEANPTLDSLLAIGKPYGLTLGFLPRHAPTATPPVTQRPGRKIPPLSFGKKP